MVDNKRTNIVELNNGEISERLWMVVIRNENYDNNKPYMQFASPQYIAKLIGMSDITLDEVVAIYRTRKYIDSSFKALELITWRDITSPGYGCYIEFYDGDGKLIMECEYPDH